MLHKHTFSGENSMTATYSVSKGEGKIADGITEIEAYAFEGKKKLMAITIPDGITEIGDCAFVGCESLTSITIPASVTKIGDNLFRYCKSLTAINFNGSEELLKCMKDSIE